MKGALNMYPAPISGEANLLNVPYKQPVHVTNNLRTSDKLIEEIIIRGVE